ncbi:AAA family ATPase [Synechococcus sp. GreenBA-s]|nr:AAA family ATPase [Synechococcus sp. GreenBA-s]
MKLSSITLSWFRGAAAAITLPANGKSLAVYGSNGAGKSSFVDALEYAIRGKVDHLSHEYSGKRQEHGLLNTHRGKADTTRIEIGLADKASRTITFGKDGAATSVGTDKPPISDWDYRRTILRQDEVSRFIGATKGDKYSALLPLLGLATMEQAAESLRLLAKAIDESAKTKELAGALSLMQSQRAKHFGASSSEQIADAGWEILARYEVTLVEGEDLGQGLARALSAIEDQVTHASAAQRRWVTLSELGSVALTEGLDKLKAALVAFAAEAQPLLDEQLAVLSAAGQLAPLIHENDASFVCPACGRDIAPATFSEHIAAETVRLERVIALRDVRDAALYEVTQDVAAITRCLNKPELATWRDEEASRKDSFEALQRILTAAGRESIDSKDIPVLEVAAVQLVEAAATASRAAPPDAARLSADKDIASTVRLILQAGALSANLAHARKVREYIETAELEVRAEIRTRASAVIDAISADVRTLWSVLQPERPITDIRLYMPDGTDKALDVRLTFHGVTQDSPRLTLSEGLRNSLGLCIFLAMARQVPHHDRPLVLDDVIVSLDRQHRGMLADVLVNHFSDRQVLLLTHDRDWFAELRQMLPASDWTFQTLLPYDSPALGIRWSSTGSSFDDARALLAARPDSAGNDARKIMDSQMMLLAERLQLHLPFVRGEKNEMRMAHTLLEYLVPATKKCLKLKAGQQHVAHKDAVTFLEDAAKRLAAWGNRASHTHDVVRPEAESLITSCETALAAFLCTECKKQVWRAEVKASNFLQCECGTLRWRYGKDG